jgi:hypothetical protein
MRLYTLIVVVLGIGSAACTQTESRSATTPVDPEVCRTAGEENAAVADSIELVLAGVSRAQANDRRCGPPEDRTRICRALFLVSTLDPAFHLEDEVLRQATGDALLWALDDARRVAPTHLGNALTELREATLTIKSSTDDSALRTAIARRAKPLTTESIDEHWQANCL